LLESGLDENYRMKYPLTIMDKVWTIHNIIIEDSCTLLHLACLVANADILKIIVEHDADVELRDTNRNTAIMLAALMGKLSVIQLLVEHGASHLTFNCNGTTLLHFAAMSGSKDIVNLLLDLGMDINAKNNKLQTPIYSSL
jgi:FOG: Ankyrin repeat